MNAYILIPVHFFGIMCQNCARVCVCVCGVCVCVAALRRGVHLAGSVG